jgi:hypothetical protein
MAWFEGFESRSFALKESTAFARFGGDRSKPALLLLHGFPQTHVMWRRVAQQLQRDFFWCCRICAATAIRRTRRACPTTATTASARMAQDLVDVMMRWVWRQLWPVRPRPRRPRGAPAGAGPRGAGEEAVRDRHRAHAGHVQRAPTCFAGPTTTGST